MAASKQSATRLATREHGGHRLPVLILMTDRLRLPDPEEAVRRLPRGSAVILRDAGWFERIALARRLRVVCRARRLKLLIAGDARLAHTLRADGLHLPERQLVGGKRSWRRWRRPGFLVTAAAHDCRALVAARRAGVDAVLLSPVFPTASHPGGRALGALRFTRLVRVCNVPVYALGGITVATAHRLSASGTAGFAGISAISTLGDRRWCKPDARSVGQPIAHNATFCCKCT